MSEEGERQPLDVWLRFDPPDSEECDAEANTYQVPAPRGRRYDESDDFVVEWYLTAVGLVTKVRFDTYDEARAWLEQQGFQDFTSE